MTEPRRHHGLSAILSSSAAGLLSIATGILILPVIISTIGSGPYGVWLVIVAVAAYLQLMDLGIGAALIHFGSRARGGDTFEMSTGHMLGAALIWNSVAGVVAVLGLVIGASLYVASGDARAVLEPGEGEALVVLGAVALGSIVLKPFGSALVGEGRLPVERRNVFIGLLARIAGSLLGCLVFDSLVMVALSETISIVLPSLLSMVAVLGAGLVPRWSRKTFKTLRFMWNFSLRSFATGSVSLLILQAGTIIAAVVATPSAVTYFTAAFRIFTGVRQVIAWTTDPFRSMLARVFVTDEARGRRLVLTLGFLALFIASTGCGIIILVADEFVRLWLGEEVPVDAIAMTITVLLTGVVLNAIHIHFSPSAEAIGRPAAFFWLQVLWLILLIPAALLFGFVWGIVGVAVGMMLPLVLIEPLYIARAQRVIGFEMGAWWRSTIVPTVLTLAGPLVIAIVLVLIWPAGSVAAALAFGFGAGGLAILLRRRPPFADVPELLRAEL